jgi:hypothetical protein
MRKVTVQESQRYFRLVLKEFGDLVSKLSDVRREAAEEYVLKAYTADIIVCFCQAAVESDLSPVYAIRGCVDIRYRALNSNGLMWKVSNRRNFDWIVVQQLQGYFDTLPRGIEPRRFEEFKQIAFNAFSQVGTLKKMIAV